MKKALTAAIIAAIISAVLTGCGCEKEKAKSKSTPDEPSTHVELITEITTNEQGETGYVETTEHVTDSVSETGQTHEAEEDDTTSPTSENANTKQSSAASSKAESKQSSSTNSSASSKPASSNTNQTNKTNTQTSKSSSSQQSSTPKQTSTSVQTSSNSGGNYSKPQTSNPGNNSTSTPQSSGTAQQSSTVDPHAGKTWHEAVYTTIYHPAETKEVKVVDQEAYTYEEPYYTWRTFCNVCQADITEDCDDHMRAHMLAHEGGRYRDEWVQYGTTTVEVPEQSHMETVVVKEAWEEKVLVREAGWY